MLRTRAGQVAGATMTDKAVEFHCPHCGALYKLVRAETPLSYDEREITCRSCGVPLRGRECAPFITCAPAVLLARKKRQRWAQPAAPPTLRPISLGSLAGAFYIRLKTTRSHPAS